MDWTERYRPETLDEIRGNDSAVEELREWAETWDDHREAAIVHGSPGIGKTSAAHALANDMGWPTIELNASDQRTKDDVERVAGEAAQSARLGGGAERTRQLVILDEADNLHGNVDRGGSRAMGDLVDDAGQPIVLIANDFYEMSRSLRNACREIEFRDVGARSIVPVLRDVCRKEDVAFEEAALERIAERTDGDLRSAINDLQAIAEGREEVALEDVVTGERDRTEGIFDFLDTLIKEADAQAALEASYDVDETPDDLIDWIEDNLPKDYRGGELADAYGHLAAADRWLGRVRARQNYSWWRYAGDNMTAGVAAARREEKGGWTRYGPPSYWSKLGRTRASRDRRDDVARRIAAESGTSLGTARRAILPYLKAMTHHCNPRELTVRMAAAYEMDAEDVSFVTGSGEDTNKVASIVADATALREDALESHAGGAFEGATVEDRSLGEDDGDDHSGDDEQATLGEVGTEEAGDGDADGGTEGADRDEDVDDAQSGLDDFA